MNSLIKLLQWSWRSWGLTESKEVDLNMKKGECCGKKMTSKLRSSCWGSCRFRVGSFSAGRGGWRGLLQARGGSCWLEGAVRVGSYRLEGTHARWRGSCWLEGALALWRVTSFSGQHQAAPGSHGDLNNPSSREGAAVSTLGIWLNRDNSSSFKQYTM